MGDPLGSLGAAVAAHAAQFDDAPLLGLRWVPDGRCVRC